jgi:hypothetical protein
MGHDNPCGRDEPGMTDMALAHACMRGRAADADAKIDEVRLTDVALMRPHAVGSYNSRSSGGSCASDWMVGQYGTRPFSPRSTSTA